MGSWLFSSTSGWQCCLVKTSIFEMGASFEVDPINQSNFSQLVALQREKKKKEEKPAVRAHIGFIFL